MENTTPNNQEDELGPTHNMREDWLVLHGQKKTPLEWVIAAICDSIWYLAYPHQPLFK